MNKDEILKDLKQNLKGLVCIDDNDNIYLFSLYKLDYVLKLQVEFYEDDSFCALTFWYLDDEEDFEIIGEENIFDFNEIDYDTFFEKPKTYLKIRSKIEQIIQLCEDNGFGFDEVCGKIKY